MSGCNFARAARRKLVLVRTDSSPDTFRPLDWYQSNTFTNIFSKCFVVFWTDISPNLKVSSCCMFPKVARNKAYCGHAYINTRPKRVCFCGRNTGHGTSFRKTHACVRQYCRQERVRTAVIWRKYVGTGVWSKKERVMAEKQPKSRSLKCMFY